MTLLLLALLLGSPSVKLAGSPELGEVCLVKNGFLGWNQFQVWHWDNKGKLIKTFGKKGQGPGEFTYISNVYWDGTYYWGMDGGNQKSSVFSSDGFLYTQPIYFRQLIDTGDDLFAVELDRISPDMVDRKTGHPPMLVKIRSQIGPQKIEHEAGPFFKKATREQAKFRYNFKNHFMVAWKDGWYVMNQQDAFIWFYDEKAIVKESKLSDKAPSNILARELGFKRFQPVESWEPSKTKWWANLCLINGLWIDGDRLLIAYMVGGEEQHLEVFDANLPGPSLGHRLLPGALAGVKDGHVYVWETDIETVVRVIPLD